MELHAELDEQFNPLLKVKGGEKWIVYFTLSYLEPLGV